MVSFRWYSADIDVSEKPDVLNEYAQSSTFQGSTLRQSAGQACNP